MFINKTRIRITYKDTDQMGIVYYARHFEFFEQGRTELLRELGIPYCELEKKGIRLPVIEAHCEYKRGIKYDEIIVVKTMLLELPTSKIRMEYEILDEKEKKILAKGYTVHPFVDSRGKARRPPKEFLHLFKDEKNREI
jgi:acyl-CoA thioester hydrolase